VNRKEKEIRLSWKKS